MAKFSSIIIKGKRFKRKIVGIDYLTPEQKKEMKQQIHLWREGYLGSVIQGDTVLEVYGPLVVTKVRIATEEEKEIDSQDPYENYELFQQIDDEEEENC